MDKLTVERPNGKSIDFVETKGKRGDWKDRSFLAPVVNKDTINDILAWCDTDIVVAVFAAEFSKRCQVWTEESTPDEGQPNAGIFNRDAFLDMARNFSARGETMGTLKGQIEDLTAQITELDMSDPTSIAKVKEYAEQIKSLRSALENKKKPKKDEVAA